MKRKSWIEHSKIHYRDTDEGTPNDNRIKIGCMQRIATATEAMAITHTRLINDNEWLKGVRDRQQEEINYLRRSNAGLKGAITRMKNKAVRDGS